MKESVRAKLHGMVRRLQMRHGYPPDKREDAVRLALEQAEATADEWVIPI
jgi:type I restriction enzyme R subunit